MSQCYLYQSRSQFIQYPNIFYSILIQTYYLYGDCQLFPLHTPIPHLVEVHVVHRLVHLLEKQNNQVVYHI